MVLVHSNDLIGKEINGRYVVEGFVGSGGSSVVVAARDIKKDRSVAVKLLHPQLLYEAGFMRRFLLESRAMSSLNHPNIMPVYDWGTFESKPFLVTELLMGGTVKEIIDSKKELSHSQVLFVAIQAARGLQHAHEKNFIHRDIKPANILFDTKCGVVIGDFGLARALSQAGWTEPVGSILGTAKYASPEQAKGIDLDGKSDVYSLGLVVFEMATGYIPFQGDSPLTTLTNRLDTTLPDDEKLGPLKELVFGSTDPNRENRLTAKQLAKGLEKLAKSLDPPQFLPIVGTKVLSGESASARLALNEIISNHDVTAVKVPEVEDPLKQDITVIKVPIDDQLSPSETDDIKAAEELSEGPDWKDNEPPALRVAKRHRKWPLVLLALIIVALIGTIAYVTNNYVLASQSVPSLYNQSVSAAAVELKNEKLVGKVSKVVYSNKVKAGYIISQYPLPQSREKPNQTVSYVVSKGPFPVALPTGMVGNAVTVVQSELTKLKFTYKITQEYSETVPVATVIAASPSVGSFQPGSVVNLTVSNGPAPRTIPNLNNMSIAEAEAALKNLVLNYQVNQAYSTSVAAGLVISSAPISGQQVPRGSTVVLTESLGPQYVKVPSVNGMTVAQAGNTLTNAGLTVSNTYGPVGSSAVAYTTNPPPGTSLVVGSSVTLYTR